MMKVYLVEGEEENYDGGRSGFQGSFRGRGHGGFGT